MMTKEQLAAQLEGREYPFELTTAEARLARENSLVVIYGASDDLAEFTGAIDDEMGAPGEFLILNGKLLPEEVTEEDEEVLRKHGVFDLADERRSEAASVVIQRSPGGSWVVKPKAPHASFQIMEDGAVFCRAAVLDLKELP